MLLADIGEDALDTALANARNEVFMRRWRGGWVVLVRNGPFGEFDAAADLPIGDQLDVEERVLGALPLLNWADAQDDFLRCLLDAAIVGNLLRRRDDRKVTVGEIADIISEIVTQATTWERQQPLILLRRAWRTVVTIDALRVANAAKR